METFTFWNTTNQFDSYLLLVLILYIFHNSVVSITKFCDYTGSHYDFFFVIQLSFPRRLKCIKSISFKFLCNSVRCIRHAAEMHLDAVHCALELQCTTSILQCSKLVLSVCCVNTNLVHWSWLTCGAVVEWWWLVCYLVFAARILFCWRVHLHKVKGFD